MFAPVFRLIAVALLVFGVTSAGAAVLTAPPKPRCYGAASRDPLKPCVNKALATRVTPTPADALLVPNAVCNRLHIDGLVRSCWFGARKADSKTTVALVGDSHASAWRAGLLPLARQFKWRGISNTRTSCAFSANIGKAPKEMMDSCREWNEQTVEWFKKHPEIETAFVVAASIPLPHFEERVEGFKTRWSQLPDTVKHIIVIRDNPRVPDENAPCIERAMRAKKPAGTECALRRSTALPRDAAEVAVRRMNSKRVKLLDLSDFFCDAQRCYPVIGGVLVMKDNTHVSKEYATTVAPYILRGLQRFGLKHLYQGDSGVLLVGVDDLAAPLLAGDAGVDLGRDRLAGLLTGVAVDLLRATALDSTGLDSAGVVGLGELAAVGAGGTADRQRREVA